jgi:hypothetical protein
MRVAECGSPKAWRACVAVFDPFLEVVPPLERMLEAGLSQGLSQAAAAGFWVVAVRRWHA